MRFTLLVALAAIVALASAGYLKCDTTASVGDVCYIKASRVKPTQFAYGRVASACKAQYLESMSSSKLDKYMTKDTHLVPVIIGWDGGFYATDHHHLTRAVLDSSLDADSKIVYLTIQKDYSHYTEAEFWAQMVKQGYTWLYDENGRSPVSPFHLAEDMYGLRNDYYRSLSYFVRTYGGYAKSNSSYAEFIWANWFRKTMPLPWPTGLNFTSSLAHNAKHASSYDAQVAQMGVNGARHVFASAASAEGPASLKWNVCDVFPYESPCLTNEVNLLLSTLNQAIKLAQSPMAKGLPGWGQGTAEEPNCNLSTLQRSIDKMEVVKNAKALAKKMKKRAHSD